MNKTLLDRLSSHSSVSGEVLAAEFGCSRAAISKQIESLRNAGVLVSARPRIGYQLDYSYQWWNEDTLRQLLIALPLSINLLESVASTNTWLRNQSPSVLYQLAITDWQQAGRGRHDREWISPPGRQFTFSLRCDVKEGPWAWQGLALAVGVEVAETLQDRGMPVQLKWPNDLWINGAKLGGVLIELDAASDGPSTIIIGLGLNEFLTTEEKASLNRPVSDLSSCSIVYSRHELLQSLLMRLVRLLSEYARMGFAAWIMRWNQLDMLRGREVQFELAGKQVKGLAQGIDEQGCLCVLTENGLLKCHSGEVSFGALSEAL